MEEHGGGGVEADPADEGEQAAEEDLDDVVAGDCGGYFVGVLALAGTQNPGDGESGEAADDLDDACTAYVGEGWKAEERGELGEPACSPDPVSEEGEEEAGEEDAPGADGGETPAVAARADGDERGEADGEHLEGEDEGDVGSLKEAGAKVSGEEGLVAEPIPRLAGEVEGVGETSWESGPSEADEDEDDGRDGESAECCEHRVGGAARASEALMDEGKTGGREGHEEDAEKADGEAHAGPR